MIGLLIIVLAQVFYAVGGLVIRKYLGGYPPLMVNGIMVVVSFLIFLPVLLTSYKSEVTGLNLKLVIPFVVAGLLWLVIAETLYVIGFQKAPSLTLASMMTLFYPLFSTVLGIIFLKEVLTVKTVVASILMMSGFVLLAI